MPMTSERRDELIQEVETELRLTKDRYGDNVTGPEDRRLRRELEILRALPVTDEGEGAYAKAEIANACGPSSASEFVAPVEGDEAQITQEHVDELQAICESLREGGWLKLHLGALQYLDPILAAVKAIVAKAPR